MSGWLIVGGVVGLVILMAGLALAVISNPGAFVYGLLKAAWPDVWTVLQVVGGKIIERMPEKLEEAWRDCQRSGGRWNHVKKKCEEPR